MPEIRDIKPTGPTWQKRRIDGDSPRPDSRRKKDDGREEKPPEDVDKPRDGWIDEYA